MVKGDTVRRRRAATRNRNFARAMRHISTEAEERFWYFVRDRRFHGWKFKRQVLIGPYIVDFVCRDACVIVELDGGQHGERVAYDTARDAFLTSQGFRVLRFWNPDVMKNIEPVMTVVLDALRASPSSALRAPSPPEGEKGLIP